eukprot:m.127398 g.127398  ORF g.127398 m.127398 type:complete len:287 (+) comp11210_c2_seq2:89-949(+)
MEEQRTVKLMPTPVKANVLQTLEPHENLLLGSLAGVVTKLINYPLLQWKNMSQQGKPLSLSPSVVYRGLAMACINLGGTTAIQFWSVGFFQSLIGQDGHKLNRKEQMAGAFMGGLVSGVPCSMFELVMVQQQNNGRSIPGALGHLVKTHGLFALTRGMIPTLGRESLYTMAMLAMAPLVQSELHTRYGMDQNLALGAGALLSSTFAATLSHPMDTIKTCMQGDVERATYPGVTGTAKVLANKYGVAQGLFKGLHLRIGLIATTFFLVNKAKTIIAPIVFKEKCKVD